MFNRLNLSPLLGSERRHEDFPAPRVQGLMGIGRRGVGWVGVGFGGACWAFSAVLEGVG